jgi:ribonucleoside-diphosphate reductase beta chain
MRDKYDYLQGCKSDTLHNIAKTVAICSAFTEGVQLFASFAILLNFPRHNKMKGMGQIITWSVRDETLHCNSMIRLFNELMRENPEVWTPKLKDEISQACHIAVAQEDAMIDLAFAQGPLENLKSEEVKQYIRWIANRRLEQLNLNTLYDVKKNPLTWLDTMLNAVEHMNFFEGRSTEYSKASTKGTWAEAFEELSSPYFNMLEKNKIVGEKEFFKPSVES